MFLNAAAGRFRRTRRTAVVTALVAGLLPVAMIAAAPVADALIPNGVSFTQEGCDTPAHITAQFTCANTTDYTTGNLGKNWAELDLVPLRVTVGGTGATASFSFAVAVDATNSGFPAFDVLSAPVLNTTLSNSSCTAPTVGAQTAANGQLLRLLTVTIPAGVNCVYDYYARLAVGAHNGSGSSTHANLAVDLTGSTSGIGTKAVSINPKEIVAQQLNKDMAANQNSDHIWDVTKSPSPVSLDFSNTCGPAATSLSLPVDITVSWTKKPATASGVINVITHVYATNPAARDIVVDVSDDIRTGATVLDTSTSGPQTVQAGTNQLVLTHTTTVPSGSLDLNDVATGSYTDPVTHVAIPGTTTATATATVQQGTELNASATITDVESISGTGLSFSVDSVSGASGDFDGTYTAGHVTTGSVSWTSESQNDTGSVTFHKTVYAEAATAITGSLADTATLNGADGFTTSDDASVDISTEAATSLSVAKSTTLDIPTAQTFTFHLYDGSTTPATATGDTATVIMPAHGNGPVSSNTISGLSATGTYFFREDATAPYGPQDSSPLTFALAAGDASTCSAVVSMTNTAELPTAQVKKGTLPNTSSGNWTFTLTGPNGFSKTLTTVVANASAYTPFPGFLDGGDGTYTITETQQTGFDLTSVAGDLSSDAARVTKTLASSSCSFTLNIVNDADTVFECSFVNTQRGALKVHKSVVKNDAGSTLSDTFTICVTGPSFATPTIANGGCQTVGINGGDLTWTNLLPGGYTVSEVNPGTPWIVAISSTSVTVNPGATASTALSTVTNTRKGRVKVVKTVSNNDGSGTAAPSGTSSYTFDLRSGATSIIGHPGTVLETLNATAGNGGVISFTMLLTPGQHYQVCETLPDVGWASSLPSQFVPERFLADGVTLNPAVINNVVCSDFVAAPGPDPTTFNVDNRRPPGGMGRTIGYWKNWASCTKSALKAKNSLDQALFLFGANGLVVSATSGGFPLFGPTYYLKLVAGSNANQATSCAAAVALLNKSAINGKKVASDAAFNLAAQLVAAELNYQAGAATTVTTQINQAVLLLGKYQFDGNTHTNISAADTAAMNTLANTLDRYNNGLI